MAYVTFERLLRYNDIRIRAGYIKTNKIYVAAMASM